MDHPDITKSQFHAADFKAMFKVEPSGSGAGSAPIVHDTLLPPQPQPLLQLTTAEKKSGGKQMTARNAVKVDPNAISKSFPFVGDGETRLDEALAAPHHFLDNIVNCSHRFLENVSISDLSLVNSKMMFFSPTSSGTTSFITPCCMISRYPVV